MVALRGAIVLSVLAAVHIACVPVPIIVPVPPLGYTTDGKPITEETLHFIRAGTTTKEDVVWELGAPDNSDTGPLDDWMSYTSWRHRGVISTGLVLIWPFGGNAMGLRDRVCRKPWTFKVWFDEAGRVLSHEFGAGETVCEWQPSR